MSGKYRFFDTLGLDEDSVVVASELLPSALLGLLLLLLLPVPYVFYQEHLQRIFLHVDLRTPFTN